MSVNTALFLPQLFNYVIDWIMDIASRYSRDIKISPEHRNINLEYAENVVLFTDNYNGYDEMRIMPKIMYRRLQRRSDSSVK